MAYLFVRAPVADYAAWRSVYDGFEPTRQTFGVKSASVYRSADDPNDVTVMLEFETVEAAKAFASSPELKDRMELAGVAGPPTIWFVQES